MVNLVPCRAKKIKHKSRVSEDILLYCKSGFSYGRFVDNGC